MKANEKDGMGKEQTGSMHPRYAKLGGRVLQWSDKNVQGMSQKG